MRKLLLFLFLITGMVAAAQQNCYQLFCYSEPAGWEKEEKNTFITYTYLNTAKKQWCLLAVYSAAIGKGDTADFRREWDELVLKPYEVKDKSVKPVLTVKKGWKIRRGKSSFSYSGQASTAMLYTVSGNGLRASIVATTNDKALFPLIEKFLTGVDINPDYKLPVKSEEVGSPKTAAPATSGFAFTSTRFDDGWYAEVKPDYVEVKKGEITVLLHYADARTARGGDPVPTINNAWDVLVAPKYKSLKYYVTRSPTDYQRALFGAGEVTDASGRSLYVAVFNRANSGWMEFITKNKQAFVAEFGIDADFIDWSTNSEVWKKMENMAYYNRFAVGQNDLSGKWTSDFKGMQDYYSVYTGSHVATTVHQSTEVFDFLPGLKYNWSLLAINGPSGAMRYDQVKNSGKFSLPGNWQLSFSNIEGKPRTYDVYFSCIRGGRLLWMQDAQYKNGWTFYGMKK